MKCKDIFYCLFPFKICVYFEALSITTRKNTEKQVAFVYSIYGCACHRAMDIFHSQVQDGFNSVTPNIACNDTL